MTSTTGPAATAAAIAGTTSRAGSPSGGQSWLTTSNARPSEPGCAAAKIDVTLAGEPGDELAQQPGLADPCLARHEHQLRSVAGGNFDGFDEAGQSRECRGATDHRRRQAVTPGQHRVDDTPEVISRRSGHFVGSPRVRIRRARRRRGSPSAARRQRAPCCGRTSRCRVAALRRRVWRSALMAAVSWLLWNMRASVRPWRVSPHRVTCVFVGVSATRYVADVTSHDDDVQPI